MLKRVNHAKDVYNGQKEVSERSDFKIEEAMLTYQRGELELEKVDAVSKQGVLIKYKAELAT